MPSSESSTISVDDLTVRFRGGRVISGTVAHVTAQIGSDPFMATALADADVTGDPACIKALQDVPYWTGDDPCDGLQGVLHLAQNLPTLLKSSVWDGPILDVPAISIAAGPTLRDHIDEIRKLQDSCLLVACDMTLDALLREGITPHVVTPIERVDLIDQGLAGRYNRTVFVGAPVVLPEVVAKFDRKMLVTGGDRFYDWIGMRRRIPMGSSTGTMSLAVAGALTTGPVYLVGHDLSFAKGKSHWDGHASLPETLGAELLLDGNSGGKVQSIPFWNRLKSELANISNLIGRVVNVNGHTGRGAKIPNTIAGPLPTYGGIMPWLLPPARLDVLASWREKARTIEDDAVGLLARLDEIRTFEDTEISKLVPGPNNVVFGYYMRSLFAQMSIECRIGHREFAIPWFRQAMRNVVEGSMDILKEVARAAD